MRRIWTVDSIEEGVAAVHDAASGGLSRVPLWMLPDEVREGDVVEVARTGGAGLATLTLRVDREATAQALQRSRAQVSEPLPPHDPGGDIVL